MNMSQNGSRVVKFVCVWEGATRQRNVEQCQLVSAAFLSGPKWRIQREKKLSFADAPWSLTRCNTYAKGCQLYTQAHTQWTLRCAHHWPLTHIKSPIHSLLNRHWIDGPPANWPTGQAGKSIRWPFSHTSSHLSQRQLSWPDTQLPQHRMLNFYVQKFFFSSYTSLYKLATITMTIHEQANIQICCHCVTTRTEVFS